MPNFERLAHVGAAVVTSLQAGIGSTDTTCTIVLDTGWPASGSNPFYVTLEKGTVKEEKILISNNAAGTLTIANRGMDGTVAQAHLAGASAQVCWTADEADEANQHYADTTLDNHTQYLNTARHDITTRHTFGNALGTPAVPSSSAPGDVATAGIGALAAREDHLHGREAVPTYKTRVSRTFAISGLITIPSGATAYIPPFFMPVPAGQSATLVNVRAMIRAGTSVTLSVNQNGTGIGGLTALSVTTTPTTTAPTTPPTVADGDQFAIVVSAISGTPDGMTVSLDFDVTV